MLTIIVLIVCYFAFLYFRNYIIVNRPLYNKTKESTVIKKEVASKTLDPKIEGELLSALEKFEKNKKYLEKDLTVGKLASLLGTNTKYVAWMIAQHRNKRTIDYIIDLKTSYVLELLEKNKNYRNYTTQALADEAGFGSAKSFLRAFRQKTAMSPAEFVAQLIV